MIEFMLCFALVSSILSAIVTVDIILYVLFNFSFLIPLIRKVKNLFAKHDKNKV